MTKLSDQCGYKIWYANYSHLCAEQYTWWYTGNNKVVTLLCLQTKSTSLAITKMCDLDL